MAEQQSRDGEEPIDLDDLLAPEIDSPPPSVAGDPDEDDAQALAAANTKEAVRQQELEELRTEVGRLRTDYGQLDRDFASYKEFLYRLFGQYRERLQCADENGLDAQADQDQLAKELTSAQTEITGLGEDLTETQALKDQLQADLDKANQRADTSDDDADKFRKWANRLAFGLSVVVVAIGILAWVAISDSSEISRLKNDNFNLRQDVQTQSQYYERPQVATEEDEDQTLAPTPAPTPTTPQSGTLSDLID